MRTDIIRLAGFLAILLAMLYVASFVAEMASDTNVYEDDVEQVLPEVQDQQELFIASGLLESVGMLLLAPVLLGLFYCLKQEDRPYFALPAAFLAVSGVLFVIGNCMEIALSDVAGNYVDATGAKKDALLQDGDTLLSLSLVTGGAAFFPYALGMLVSGVLMLRSAFFPKWVSWPTIAVGALGLIVFVSFIFVLPGRVLWLLAIGITMLMKSGPERTSVTVPQTAPVAP